MIEFKHGSQAQYDVSTKSEGVLYFIEDTHRIYRGSTLISGVEAEIVTDVPEFSAAVSGVIYVVCKGDFPEIYIKGQSEMKPIQAKVTPGSIDSVTAFSDDVLITSDETLTTVTDDQIPTAKAVKDAIDEATPEWGEI